MSEHQPDETPDADELEPDAAPGAEPDAEPDQGQTGEDGADADHGGEDEGPATGADDAPPDEQTPTAPRSQAEIEELQQRLDREAKRHANAVEKIMGDDFAMLVPSPLDFTPGYLWHPELVPVPDEVRAAVYALLNMQPPDELPVDPDVEVCSKCQGYGKLTTGSRVPQQDTRVCTQCSGQGWRQKLVAVPPAAAAPDVHTLTQPAAAGGSNPPPADVWGRPVGHPHYGVHPASITA